MAPFILVLAHEMSAQGVPSALSLERLKRAADLFHDTDNAELVTTGWAYRDDTELSLADAMATYARDNLGVPAERIQALPQARDTVGDAVFFANQIDAKQVSVVTSAFHKDRTAQIFGFVLGPDVALEVIGTGAPATPDQEASEARSLDAFRKTFQEITPGDLPAITERLHSAHPLYNGAIDAKELRRHD